MGMWGTRLNSENWGTAIELKTGRWSSKIPTDLVRHELLAPHQTNTPQFYPECAQIEVQGNGSALPPDTHKFSIDLCAHKRPGSKDRYL
ncbi:hypothetical protein RB601_003570 [Gaeumannomyces tritici]